jgi:hypothetical protein
MANKPSSVRSCSQGESFRSGSNRQHAQAPAGHVLLDGIRDLVTPGVERQVRTVTAPRVASRENLVGSAFHTSHRAAFDALYGCHPLAEGIEGQLSQPGPRGQLLWSQARLSGCHEDRRFRGIPLGPPGFVVVLERDVGVTAERRRAQQLERSGTGRALRAAQPVMYVAGPDFAHAHSIFRERAGLVSENDGCGA